MAILVAFAFVSGIITILSPCILPVLPIVLSGSVGRGGARPYGVVTGFVITFTTFTLALTAIVHTLRLPADTLRYVAVALLVLLGIIMLVPKLHKGFTRLASLVSSRFSMTRSKPAGGDKEQRAGFWSGIAVGFSLGAVWTPCVGPIMASVIGLALTRSVDSGAVLITLAYAVGTALPMLAVMLGGRTLLNRVPGLTRNMAKIQTGFGVVMMLLGVVIGFGWDREFQKIFLRAFPDYGTGLTAIEKVTPVRKSLEGRRSIKGPDETYTGLSFAVEPKNGILGDYGPAPDLVADGRWFNTSGITSGKNSNDIDRQGTTPPRLTMAGLLGKVVVVDFWTYSCVNCVRTIPYLKSWYDIYRNQGLVIIGVHTPEFEFEKKPANVQRAIKQLGIDWPVFLDNDYAQWNAYGNRYWPAHYFIDATGGVRYFHFGEGEYDVSEQVIRALLREAGADPGKPVLKPNTRFTSRTPEIYLGLERGRGLVSENGAVLDQAADYRPARRKLSNGQWALSGKWFFSTQYIASRYEGVLELGFHASNVFLVVEPEEPGGRIEVRVDGRVPKGTADVSAGVLSPSESRLYQLVEFEKPGEHILHLDVKGKLRLFSFTFG